ncbi:MAG: flagellar motor switch protein FliG, partial [Gammaproteobacteria bacterium]|nr:flagellar motor switch protein FliG [Gammaproteobacteria bacterium]
MSRRKEDVAGARKAALLLLSMPQENAARVLSHLSEAEVAEIATEIASLGEVAGDAANVIVDEFSKLWEKRHGNVSGGLGRVRGLLELAAPDRVDDIVSGIDRRV